MSEYLPEGMDSELPPSLRGVNFMGGNATQPALFELSSQIVSTPPLPQPVFELPAAVEGVWVAFEENSTDDLGPIYHVIPFASELDALRHAVARQGWSARFVEYGTDLRDVNE